jgi:hypothetical protein
VYEPIFFVEKTITGSVHMDISENQLWPQMAEDIGQESRIFQQDRAPPHYHWEVPHFFDE